MKSLKVSEDHYGKNKKSLYDNMSVKKSDEKTKENFSCYCNDRVKGNFMLKQ